MPTMSLQETIMHLNGFKRYIYQKDIVLVGNSISSLQEYNKDFIDDFDLVLRFGKGIPSPNIEEHIGTKTNIWATGPLRAGSTGTLPEGTKILFNNSLAQPEAQPFSTVVDHLQMYSQEEINALGVKYGLPEDRRLSNGAVTSHWLTFVAKGWGSITWINFDCFRNNMLFYNQTAKQNTVSSSWHLPLLKPQYAHRSDDIADKHPAHCPMTETRLYDDCLAEANTYWTGERLETSRMLHQPKVMWTKGRSSAR